MSKIGKKPIELPQGVEAIVEGSILHIKGKLGELILPILQFTQVKKEGIILTVEKRANHKQARSNWGTMASLLENAVLGVHEGYTKRLQIEGVGFRAEMKGDLLLLNVGFSHPVEFPSPQGVKIEVVKNMITVSGIDKQAVGEVAAKIRKIKKPEPYKGKGIRYEGEIIRRKAGKKAVGAGA